MFQDPVSRGSIGIREREWSPEKLRERLSEVRGRLGVTASEPGIGDVLDDGEVRIRFRGREEAYPVAAEDIMEAVRHAESLSAENPGEPVVFILDEGGVTTEDTYVNGSHVGETVEKFAFRATR